MTETAIPAPKPAKVTHKGLVHAYAGLKTEAFFQHIDEKGGWPLDYPYVGFAHSDEREAAFTMEPTHSGWWTTLYHRDDYLMWKLSPAAWTRIFDGVRDDLVQRMRGQGALLYGPTVRGWRDRGATALHPEFEQRAVKAIIDRASKVAP